LRDFFFAGGGGGLCAGGVFKNTRAMSSAVYGAGSLPLGCFDERTD